MQPIYFDSTLSLQKQKSYHFQVIGIFAAIAFIAWSVLLHNIFELSDGVRGITIFISFLVLLGCTLMFIDFFQYKGCKGFVTEKEVTIEPSEVYGFYRQYIPVGKRSIKSFTSIIFYRQPIPKSMSSNYYVALRSKDGKEILLINPDETNMHIAMNIRDRLHIMTGLPVMESMGKLIKQEKFVDDNLLPKDEKLIHSADSKLYDMFGRINGK